MTLAVSEMKTRQAKDAERQHKVSIRTGKDTSFGRIRENLPPAGDAKNGTAGL